MPTDVRLLNRWKVFINGVEIPFLSLTAAFTRNSYGMATIQVEPDGLVHQFRPNSNVLIFFHDEFADETPADQNLEEKLRLYFEGELVGLGHSKTPTSRMMTLSASGKFRVYERHKLFQSSIGGSFTTPHFTGGYAIREMAGSEVSTDVLSLGGLSYIFSKDAKFDKEEFAGDTAGAAFRSSKEPDFGERILSLITFMSTFNGSLRLSIIRDRLINKVAGVPDSCLSGLINATLTNAYFKQVMGDIPKDGTILDLINRFCAQAFYSWFQIPGPFTPPTMVELPVPITQGGNTIQKFRGQPRASAEVVKAPKNLGQDNDIYYLIRDFYRNDYLFVPELYYAMPPPCNFFFPEDIESLSFSRQFDLEPTRFVLTEPYYAKGKAAFFAPVDVLRNLSTEERAKISPAEFFSANINAMTALGEQKSSGTQGKSPFTGPIHGDQGGISLLSVIGDDEIEKGILCKSGAHDFEIFSAVARSFDLSKSPEDVTFGEEGGEPKDPYVKFMTKLVKFRLSLEKAMRSLTITSPGMRWVVPGFSTIVFDKDSSYLGFIESVQYSVDVSSGQEKTIVGLSKVRTIPYIPANALDVLKKDQQDNYRDNLKSKKDLILQYITVMDHIKAARDAMISSTRTINEIVDRTDGAFNQECERLGSYILRSTKFMNTWGYKLRVAMYGGSRSEGTTRFLGDHPEIPEVMNVWNGVPNNEEYINGYLPVFDDFPTNSAALKTMFTSTDEHARYSRLNANDLITQAQKLSEDILVFLRYMINELKTAFQAGKTPAVDTLKDAKMEELLAKSLFAAKSISAELERLTGFFTPPSWFNQGFLKISTIDKIYGALLGCPPFYSTFGNDLGGLSPSEAVTDVNSFSEYQKFLQILDKVFPILSREGAIPPVRTGPALWEELSSKDNVQPGSKRQLIQKIQRREVTSLKTFLSQHKLKVRLETSYPPSEHTFMVLTPVNGPSSGAYGFDNSIFSMIVDEWEMNPGYIPKAAGMTSKDPEINKLRKTAANATYLKTEGRQSDVIEYSRRHFGARAFDGR